MSETPTTYLLTPEEPTNLMLFEGYRVLSRLYEQKATSRMEIRETAAECYRVMLANSPVRATIAATPLNKEEGAET